MEATSATGVRAHTLWSIADQIISSASNALLPLAALALLSGNAAGRVSVLLSFVFFALGVCRSLLGETFLLTLAGTDGGPTRQTHRDMLGAALALGLVFGAAIGAISIPLVDTGGRAVLLGLGFAAVVVQDTARYAFFAQLQARRAVVSDALWLGLFLMFVVVARSDASSSSLLVAWVVAGGAAGAVGAWQLRALPRLLATAGVVRSLARLGIKIGAEFVAVSGLPQALIAIVGLSASLTGAAAYRLATTVLSPSGVIVTGVITALQPVCVRSKDEPGLLRCYVRRATVVGLCAVAACVVMAWLVPRNLGSQLLGDAFGAGRRLCIPLGVASLAQSASAAANLAVRARARVMDAVRIRFGFGIACLAAAVPVAHRWGGNGAAWLYAACSLGAFGGLLLSPAMRFRGAGR